MSIEVPLHRAGRVVAHARIEPDDLALVSGFRWALSPSGYALAGSNVSMHRLIVGLKAGEPLEVDHINGDRVDNRRANLRIVTRAQNQQNRQTNYGRSRYRGVYWNKRDRRWRAQAQVGGKRFALGDYLSETDAARAAAAFRAEHMPFSSEARAA